MKKEIKGGLYSRVHTQNFTMNLLDIVQLWNLERNLQNFRHKFSLKS